MAHIGEGNIQIMSSLCAKAGMFSVLFHIKNFNCICIRDIDIVWQRAHFIVRDKRIQAESSSVVFKRNRKAKTGVYMVGGEHQVKQSHVDSNKSRNDIQKELMSIKLNKRIRHEMIMKYFKVNDEILINHCISPWIY